MRRDAKYLKRTYGKLVPVGTACRRTVPKSLMVLTVSEALTIAVLLLSKVVLVRKYMKYISLPSNPRLSYLTLSVFKSVILSLDL